MHRNVFKSFVLLCLVGSLIWYAFQSKSLPPQLPASLNIQSDAILPVDYTLQHFAMDTNSRAYGVSGNKLYRIDTISDEIDELFKFESSVVGFHITRDNRFIISTDDNHWDESIPCNIYESFNPEGQFTLIKEIEGGCALDWSLSSDDNFLYIGEYGPKEPGLSKNVWRRNNQTKQWDVIFKAKTNSDAHIHRVAVDQKSGNLWVTVGDTKKNRGIYLSVDQGKTWTHEVDSQATSVAFIGDQIYWGEDNSKFSGVLTTDKNGQQLEKVFSASEFGNYHGSIYQLLKLPDDSVLAPIMKYPEDSNAASLWQGKGMKWRLLMVLESLPGQGVDVSSIAGPDINGYILISGFKIDYGRLIKIN